MSMKDGVQVLIVSLLTCVCLGAVVRICDLPKDALGPLYYAAGCVIGAYTWPGWGRDQEDEE